MTNNQNLLKHFMISIFEDFKKAKISFCILKNYQKLPFKNVGSDIDFLVDQTCLERSFDILLKIIKEYRLDILQVLIGPDKYVLRLHKLFITRRFFLQLDVSSVKQFYGMVYLSSDNILSRRKTFRDFFIPNPTHESIICWLAPFLYGGGVKKRYKKFVEDTVQRNKNEFFKELSYIVGKKMSLQVYPMMAGGNWQEIERFRLAIRLSVLVRALFRKPVHSMRNFGKLLCTTLAYQLSPPGMFAALLGPDGSGKTTIAERTYEILRKIYRSDDGCLIHWRPGVLPQLNRLFSKITLKKGKGKNDIRPMKSNPSGFIPSLFRLIYYSLDYLFGFFLFIRPKLHRGKLVIFDRYYYNFIVDPYRSKISLPKFIRYFFMIFIPKPDVVICLENDPTTILTRKQELSIEELKQQINDYRNLTLKLPNGYVVNGDESIAGVTNEVIDIILKKQAQKVKRI
jgi:thymidylate kinase